MDEPRVKQGKKPRKVGAATNENAAKAVDGGEDTIASLAGTFKDDPLWDDYIEAMRRARAEEDAMEEVSGMGKHAMSTGKQRDGLTATPDQTKDTRKEQPEDPVAELAGILKDDPTWDEFIEAMRLARAEEEATEDVPR